MSAITPSGLQDTSTSSWTSTVATADSPTTDNVGSSESSTMKMESYSTAIVDAIKELISTTSETSQFTTTSSITTRAPTTTTTITTTTAATSTVSMSTSSTSDDGILSHRVNVADLSHSLQHFGIVDYVVFVLMLVVCAVIGFYFGFIEKKNKGKKGKETDQTRGDEERRGSEALDYLVGGRKMKVFPVSLSLVASFISGISLLGTSTEIYVYGTQYAFILFTLVLSGIISWYVFLPVFCNLQLTSTYEYFEMRFDKTVRLFGSTLFTFGMIIWLPIVIYVPALSFNQVTGIDTHVVTLVVCIVCIFYTCVGGLKAVVWTDVVQTFVMVGAILFVIVKGTLEVGGLGVVWERNKASGRIESLDMTLDPTVRISVLSMFVGGTIHNLQLTAASQVITQRYLSVPGLKEARKASIYFTIGITVLTFLTCYNGLLIHATYYDCDPLTTKLAKAGDQLVPLLVMDVLGFIPGLPGVFVAGVFSAALSSLSTGLNSLSAILLEDYIKPNRKDPLTERQIAFIMRLSVIAFGIVCVGLVYVVERLGSVILINLTFGSVVNGPLLSLFLMGFLMPWINGKSALFGCIASVCITTVIVVKGQLAIALGEYSYPVKPVSTEGCDYAFEAFNSTSTSPNYAEPQSFWDYLFRISFFLYIFVGASLTIIFANLASLYFGRNDSNEVDPALLAPVTRRFLKKQDYKIVSAIPAKETVISDLDEEMKML